MRLPLGQFEYIADACDASLLYIKKIDKNFRLTLQPFVYEYRLPCKSI